MINMQLATEKGVGAFDELKEHAKDQGVSWERLVSAIHNGGTELSDVSKEMGFTSSELKKMYKEADKSKTSLEQFGDVAGMTGEQFAQMFKENPAEAVMKFVEGLGKAEEKGNSAIKVLDDMDIKEVRLRDSLLRAASASDVFSDAVKSGNKAFGENTALTEEASKRYETTESKLKMLRNEAKNVAIDLGGPFVDALRDGLESSKPLIKGLGDLAKKFSDMDPKAQQAIIKFIGLTAAAGPLLSITGKVTTGIGKLGGSFIDLSAKLAKKKAIEQTTKLLAEGAISTTDFTSALSGGTGIVANFGGAAATASGAGGLGAMTAALGPLGPAILGIVGVGGALAVGYGAWKLFGEEAWNSSQRVARWGSDVGETTDETLTKIQTNTQKASGEFSLLEKGFSTNTDKMVGNFERIGQTIEDELTQQIDALKGSLDLLPEEIRGAGEEIINAGAEKREKALAIVQKNNDRILEIKKQYVDKDGEITIQGAKMIQDLMRQSTQEYLNITVKDADARREVMDALNGDVENASQQQAEAWLKSLGKQRQETKSSYTQQLEDYKAYLDEHGVLNTEEGEQLVELFEKARDQSTETIDAQMAIIAEKYPELAEKISLVNGQTISSMGEAGEAAKKANQDIINNAKDLSNQLAANAKKNAKALAWTADESTKAGQIWNSLELIDKEGNIKTNANEIVTEATKDAQTWNDLKLVVHDADLDSNAKKVIGEAAIANGYWDGMAWEDKKAILEDEFSQTMYKALDDSGKWDQMSFEEKKAFLYSNTPEVMTETMLKLGLWDEYQPEIKDLDADNYKFLDVLSKSETKLKNWNELPDDTKNLYADNYDFLTKIYESEDLFKRWEQLPSLDKKILAENTDFLNKILESDTEWEKWTSLPAGDKILLADNQDFLTKIFSSETLWNQWENLPDSNKKMLADNTDLMTKVFSSQDSYNAWSSLPDDVKDMLANNEDILSKVRDGTISVEDYNQNVLPALKKLFGDNSDIIQKLSQGESSLKSYDSNNPAMKFLNGDSSSTQQAAKTGGSALDLFGNNNPAMKYLEAKDNASRDANAATESVKAFRQQKDHTVTLTSIVKNVTQWITEKFNRDEKGTNFHPGGLALVNDQKGPLYKEIVKLPNGRAFIPQGRNVMLDLPVGSKVIKASETKALMERFGVPKYAQGIGVPKDATLIRNLQSVGNRERTQTITVDNSDLVQLMRQMLNAISRLSPEINVYPQNWDTKNDIRRTAQELALLTQIEGRGALE